MHRTKCLDEHSLEVDQDLECCWCHKPTKRLDLDYEVAIHPDCLDRMLDRESKIDRVVYKQLLEWLGFKS